MRYLKKATFPSFMSNDLSPYELLRLERIKANEAKLVELGLGPTSKLLTMKPKPQAPKRRYASSAPKAAPSRRSSRLREISVNVVSGPADEGAESDSSAGEDIDDEGTTVQYDLMPVEPEHLDDSEFLVSETRGFSLSSGAFKDQDCATLVSVVFHLGVHRAPSLEAGTAPRARNRSVQDFP